jgi:hypothetical protein
MHCARGSVAFLYWQQQVAARGVPFMQAERRLWAALGRTGQGGHFLKSARVRSRKWAQYYFHAARGEGTIFTSVCEQELERIRRGLGERKQTVLC